LLKENQSLISAVEKLAKETLQEDDIVAFSAKRSKFRRFILDLEGIFLLLHSLRGDYSSLERDIRASEDSIEAKARIFRSETTIHLAGDISNEYKQVLEQRMREAGLTVDQATECSDAKAFVMTVSGSVTPTEGPMGGKLSKIKIVADIQDCSKKQKRTVFLNEGKGYHSTSIERSKEEAWKSIRMDALPPKVASLFPVLD